MAVKKRRFYFVWFIFIITLVLIGIKIKIDKENIKIMNSREVGGEDDIMYHLLWKLCQKELLLINFIFLNGILMVQM